MEYVERPAGAMVVYTAPHPWENGAKAWHQLRHVESLKHPAFDAYWAVGIKNNASGYDPETGLTNTTRFHVTADEISGESFPRLGELMRAPLPYAVAFHGTGPSGSCGQGVKVGGRLGYEKQDKYLFRRGIAENIQMSLGPAVNANQVHYQDDTCGNSYNGTGPDNVVNRIGRASTAGGSAPRGIQIETGYGLSQVAYDRVGEAVRAVFDCLNEPADATNSVVAISAGAAYASGRCNGFIVELHLPSATSRVFHGGLRPCRPGARAHVDIYKRNMALGAWDRIGGGDVRYSASCSRTYVSPADWDPGAFTPTWQPGPEGTTAGWFRMVVHGYAGESFSAAHAQPVFACAASVGDPCRSR
jgi:hypothetical protein